MTVPAEQLLGRKLDGGWKVIENGKGIDLNKERRE